MLKYMRNAGLVWRVRLETNAEDVVLVVPCHMQILSAGFVVLKM